MSDLPRILSAIHRLGWHAIHLPARLVHQLAVSIAVTRPCRALLAFRSISGMMTLLRRSRITADAIRNRGIQAAK
jgi:hypothetical protein